MASCAGEPPAAPADPRAAEGREQPLKETIPLTLANLRGHQTLYDEGWFIVSSSREALRYAQAHAVESAGEALAEAKREIAQRSGALPAELAQGVREGVQTGVALHETGAELSARVTRATRESAARQRDFAFESFGRSWAFVAGGLYYGKRTPEHWHALKTTWSQYYGDLQADFSNVEASNARLRDRIRPSIEADWDGAWREGAAEFRRKYEESGEAPNALVALGDLFVGYVRSFFVGVVKPSARSVAVGAAAGARATAYVFMPVADSIYLTGRTLQATGLSIYHVGRTTVDIFAPSVEAGLLAGLGLLSLGSASATFAGGEALGLVNQVALTGAGAVAGTAEAGVRTAADSAQYVALVTYDVGKAGTRVIINQAQSGVVLGYNALTALPVQMVMGISTGAFFLAWDGPKLVIVKVFGRPKSTRSDPGAPDLSALPVGAVVDLKRLREQEDVQVDVVTDDPEVTQRVLERVQADARQP